MLVTFHFWHVTALQGCRLNPLDMDYVVCTSGHPDKVGNLNLFTKAKHIVSGVLCFQDNFFQHAFKQVYMWKTYWYFECQWFSYDDIQIYNNMNGFRRMFRSIDRFCLFYTHKIFFFDGVKFLNGIWSSGSPHHGFLDLYLLYEKDDLVITCIGF